MALGSCYIFFFQTHFRSVKFKGLPVRDDASNSERTSYHYSRLKKIIDIFRTFYQRKLWHSFLDWEPKGGDNIHQVQLNWSRQNLSLPISSEHLFWIRFRPSAKLSGFPSCIKLLVHDLRFALQY